MTTPLDRTGKPPLYSQVAEALRADIRSGLYQPGVAIPSERKLMARFGVTRTTIRTALERLRDEGLLTSEHGAGSFVRSSPWPGPAPGESWPDWLRRQVKEASPFDVPGALAFVVLQPDVALAIAEVLEDAAGHFHSAEFPCCPLCDSLAALDRLAEKEQT